LHVFQGTLRINQRNYEEAYVDNPEGNDQVDILILGIHDRNRALHGDVVVVRVKDRSHWIVSLLFRLSRRESMS
jgi:exoribonuclease R